MRFASSTSCAAVSSWWRPASRRKSWSASVVVSTGAVSATTASERGACLDDLDRAPVELAQERVLLELRQLVRLRHLGEVGHADASDLLRLLEQLPDLLDEEDVVDVDLGHTRQGTQELRR